MVHQAFHQKNYIFFIVYGYFWCLKKYSKSCFRKQVIKFGKMSIMGSDRD